MFNYINKAPFTMQKGALIIIIFIFNSICSILLSINHAIYGIIFMLRAIISPLEGL